MDRYDYPTSMETDGSARAAGNIATDGLSLIPPPIASGHTAEEPSASLPIRLQRLSDEYVASYDDEAFSNATRMTHAKAFAIALLQYYYPETEGYRVRSRSLGPMVKHGINFYLKAKNGKDPFPSLPPKKDNKKGKKKPSKAQLDRQRLAEEDRQYDKLGKLTWHFIEPENIAGFVILQKSPKDTEYRPLTYLAIIIDDLKTFPFIATTNDVHRSDILTEALCRTQQIRSGYGVLLYGTRLEVYDFDNGEETEIIDSEDGEVTITAEEPVTTLPKNNHNEAMVLDLKTADLQQVDVMFRGLALREVGFLVEDVDLEEGLDLLAGSRLRGPEHFVFPLSNVRNEIEDFI